MYQFEPDEELIRKTVEFWQPRYRKPLTREDALEIIGNFQNLLDLFERWVREEAAERGRPKS
jgi:hypothetical protein